MLQQKEDDSFIKANSIEELFIDSLLSLDFHTLEHLIISGRLERLVPGIKTVRENVYDEESTWEKTKKVLTITPNVESIRIAALINYMRPFDSNLHIALEIENKNEALEYFKVKVAPNITLSSETQSEIEFLLKYIDIVSKTEKLPLDIERLVATSSYIYKLIYLQEAHAKSSTDPNIRNQKPYLEKIEFEYRPEENW